MTNPNYPTDETEFDAHIQQECKRIQADWKEADFRRRAGLAHDSTVLRPVTLGVTDGQRVG